MRYLVLGSLVLAVAGSPALGQGKTPKKAMGLKKAERACKAAVSKYLKGRSLKRLAKLEWDPRNKMLKKKGKYRRARWVIQPKAVARAEWGFLPKAYSARFKRTGFVPYFRPQDSRPIVDSFSIESVGVGRESVHVVYSYTPARPFAYFTEQGKARTYTRPKRSVKEVWVRQGGRFVMSRRFAPLKGRKANAAVKADCGAISGEALVDHAWWPGTMSVNAMLARNAEAQVKAQGDASAVAEIRKALAATEIADVGVVVEVDEGRVRVGSGGLVVWVQVASAEWAKRAAFYKALKKGDRVVFRCSFEAESATDFSPQERSDGKATLEAWAE